MPDPAKAQILPAGHDLSTRIRPWLEGALIGGLILGASLVSDVLGYRFTSSSLEQQMRSGLLRTARIAAALVDGDLHASLVAPEQEQSEAYRRALRPLQQIQRLDPEIRYIYTMVLRDGWPHFVLDATPPGDRDRDGVEDHAALMERYAEPTPVMLEALRSGQALVERELSSDRWGTALSAYAPIRDRKGAVVGVVGVDLSAERYLAYSTGLRRVGLSVAVLTFLIAFGVATAVAIGRRASHRVGRERDRSEQELREQQARLQALIESNPLGIVVLDPDHRIQMCNRAFEQMFQYTEQEIRGQALDQLIVPEETRAAASAYSQRAALGQQVRLEGRRLRKDGGLVDVEVHGLPLIIEGRLTGVFAIYQDVTERRQAEQAIAAAQASLNAKVGELERRSREDRLLGEMVEVLQACGNQEEAYGVIGNFAGRLFPGSSGALFITAASGNVAEALSSWGSAPPPTTVFAPSECWALRRGRIHTVRDPATDLICGHLAAPASARSTCVPLVAQGESLGVLQLQFPEPEEGRHDPGGERLIQLLAENLALALANLKLRETLRYQSIRDPLTGLFNRRYLEESLERELHRARRGKRAVAVLMLDLDHFKRFNDEHGHAAGDALLREVGGLLKNKVRGSDVACRYGGEELAIILPEAELRDAAHRADQIRDAIRRLAIQQAGQTLGSVTVSIGIATYPQHGESVEQLLSQADAALYRAKDLGRDRVELAGEG